MLFDYNKSGKISARDIGPVIRSVGLKPSQAEVRSIMTEVQQSGRLHIELLIVTMLLSMTHVVLGTFALQTLYCTTVSPCSAVQGPTHPSTSAASSDY